MIGLDFDRAVRTAVGVFGEQGKINGAAVTILTVSFLAAVVLEWRKQLRGERPDWAGPVTRLITFGLLLGFYSLVARSLIEVVSSLGDLQSIDPSTAKKSVFAARAEAFSQSLGDDAEFSLSNLELSAAALINSLLDVATYLTFTLAAACVFILKVIQKVMLNVLLTLGPVMIAFASIPGLTSSYLAAWLLGLIEVTAWGVTAKIFLSMLLASERATTVNPNVTQNLAEHIVFNLVYAVSFLVIPIATATILRGGAGALAQGGLAAAKRAAIAPAAAAAGATGAAAGVAGAAKSAVAGDQASGATTTSTERAGDRPAEDPDARRAAFARDAAIRKQERERSDDAGGGSVAPKQAITAAVADPFEVYNELVRRSRRAWVASLLAGTTTLLALAVAFLSFTRPLPVVVTSDDPREARRLSAAGDVSVREVDAKRFFATMTAKLHGWNSTNVVEELTAASLAMTTPWRKRFAAEMNAEVAVPAEVDASRKASLLRTYALARIRNDVDIDWSSVACGKAAGVWHCKGIATMRIQPLVGHPVDDPKLTKHLDIHASFVEVAVTSSTLDGLLVDFWDAKEKESS